MTDEEMENKAFRVIGSIIGGFILLAFVSFIWFGT
jgi:hypothetical protein